MFIAITSKLVADLASLVEDYASVATLYGTTHTISVEALLNTIREAERMIAYAEECGFGGFRMVHRANALLARNILSGRISANRRYEQIAGETFDRLYFIAKEEEKKRGAKQGAKG